MKLEKRIEAFVKLGEFLNNSAKYLTGSHENEISNNDYIKGFQHQIRLAEDHNSWFSQANILYSIRNWGDALTEENINQWLSNFNLKTKDAKTVAIVMAGNIPLVGFHDFISVLISGHKVLVKQSSDDKHLLPYLSKYLETVEPDFKGMIEFTEGKLEHYDAVIATGSNNTSRYFEYYFKDKPSIIRKNRNSIAVLTGNESEAQLNGLAEDIFRYYGLGCRNVSKVFVPEYYNFEILFNAVFSWKEIINENKYANNYDYNKAVYLMSEFEFLDNGFLILKEDESYSSPIATLFYEKYTNLESLKDKLKDETEHIQCIVSDGIYENAVEFGNTQNPKLWDYADKVDTIEFLSNL